MEKFKIIWVLSVFIFAVTGAMALNNNTSTAAAYGFTSLKPECIVGSLLQDGCSLTNAGVPCTVLVSDINSPRVTEAYGEKFNGYICTVPLRQWQP